MTFDILADVYVGSRQGWVHHHEVTARCRHCHRPSLLLVRMLPYEARETYGRDGTVTAFKGDISTNFAVERAISIADLAAKDAPEHLPDDIGQAFNEGTRCLAIGCHNASAAMFRLCLDLATKALLPDAQPPEGPSKRQRYSLGHRLEWLFERAILPADLKDLSEAVKENGNDGAHDGALDDTDADDLYDFSFALLERLYTQPARIEEAKARRADRRAKGAEAG